MFYPRDIYSRLEKELETPQATVITGMRRVGKTTALKYLYSLVNSPNKAFFDFESPLHRQLFELQDYDSILNNLQRDHGINPHERAYLFLDEIQNYPPVTSIMKYLHDHYETKFFVTGSSSYYLKNLFPESMAGRKLIFEMFPLTFREFLRFRSDQIKIKITPPSPNFQQKVHDKNYFTHSSVSVFYKEYLQYGGFPEVAISTDPTQKLDIQRDIFKSYFEIDVKSLADFRNLEMLRNFILLLVPRIGSKLDISKLSSELGISRETVNNYLTFLESTYLITRLSRYSKSIDQMISGPKKFYFCDVGIASALGNLSAGQALEQSVFQNLRATHELHYYATPKGGEIDFVVDKHIALEVKKHAIPRDLANLHKRMTSAKLSEGYLITEDFQKLEMTIPATDL